MGAAQNVAAMKPARIERLALSERIERADVPEQRRMAAQQEAAGRLRFTGGTYVMSAYGVRASATSGALHALRAWSAKVQREAQGDDGEAA